VLGKARGNERESGRRLIELQKSERRALARELHDGFVQALTAAGRWRVGNAQACGDGGRGGVLRIRTVMAVGRLRVAADPVARSPGLRADRPAPARNARSKTRSP